MVFERFLSWLDLAPADERAEAARALAAAYLRAGPDGPEGEEGETADAVLTALVDDPEVEVRRALAQALSGHPGAPRHIIMALAADCPEVAMIVLARSPVFVDAELVDRVAGGVPEHQIVIACRPAVSPAIGAAIAEVGVLAACFGLLSNPCAELQPAITHRIAERFGDEAEIRRLLFRNRATGPRTRVMLIGKLSEAMANETPGDLVSGEKLATLLRDNCDRAVIAFAAKASQADLTEIAKAVIEHGAMNTAFLLRAVCMGNIALFTAGIAALAKVPLSRVESALADDRRTVFRTIYGKAGLPDFALGVFSSAIDCWRRLLASGDEVDLARLPFLVTREVLSTYTAGGDANLDALLVLLRKLAAEATRHNARNAIARMSRKSEQEAVLALAPPESQSSEEDENGPNTKEKQDMVIPASVIAEFAVHFAEEIVDLEEELTLLTAGQEIPSVEAIPAVDMKELEAALSVDELIMPERAANDSRRAPAVRSIDATMPPVATSQSSSVLVGATREHLKRRQAA